jgi:hypothetical protein
MQLVLPSVKYVPCFWELYYCVPLAMRRVECANVLKCCDIPVGVFPRF